MSSELFDNSSQVQNPGLTGSTEILILANAIQKLYESSGIVFLGTLYLTPGINVDKVTVRIRAGYGTSGAINWEVSNIDVWPGKVSAISLSGIFTGSQYELENGGQYSVTVQQEAEIAGEVPANGVVNSASVAWFNTQFDV